MHKLRLHLGDFTKRREFRKIQDSIRMAPEGYAATNAELAKHFEPVGLRESESAVKSGDNKGR